MNLIEQKFAKYNSNHLKTYVNGGYFGKVTSPFPLRDGRVILRANETPTSFVQHDMVPCLGIKKIYKTNIKYSRLKMTGRNIRPAPAEIEFKKWRFLITDQPQV